MPDGAIASRSVVKREKSKRGGLLIRAISI